MVHNYMRPVLGLAAVTILATTAAAQQTAGQASERFESAMRPTFKAASIKPNTSGDTVAGISSTADGLFVRNYTLQKLIRTAYGVQDDQITSAGPNWVNSQRYDVEAKMDRSVADQLQKLGSAERSLETLRMLQALLADRFRLTFHTETEQIPVYALVIAENGLKLQRAMAGDTYPNGIKGLGDRPVGAGATLGAPGKFVGQGVPIAKLVELLSDEYHLRRTVLDKTGLTDRYDFTLQWKPDDGNASLFTPIQEQLGLNLESETGSREILVVDHAEKPSEN